jgi:hypothetical protein
MMHARRFDPGSYLGKSMAGILHPENSILYNRSTIVEISLLAHPLRVCAFNYLQLARRLPFTLRWTRW